MRQKCTSCDKPHPNTDWRLRRVWWTLSGYKGFFGYFCPECYDILHSDDEAAITVMRVKLRIKQAS